MAFGQIPETEYHETMDAWRVASRDFWRNELRLQYDGVLPSPGKPRYDPNNRHVNPLATPCANEVEQQHRRELWTALYDAWNDVVAMFTKYDVPSEDTGMFGTYMLEPPAVTA